MIFAQFKLSYVEAAHVERLLHEYIKAHTEHERCDGKGWYYREWSDDATGRSMKRQKQPCDKCEARTNEPIDYDTVELIT